MIAAVLAEESIMMRHKRAVDVEQRKLLMTNEKKSGMRMSDADEKKQSKIMI